MNNQIDPSTLNTHDSETINSAVSNMSDTELSNILINTPSDVAIDTLVKCNDDSLDKIFRVRFEQSDEFIKQQADDETKRLINVVDNFFKNENPNIEDFMNILKETSLISEQLKKENMVCENDIKNLESAIDLLKGNMFMYKDDIDSELLKQCNEKLKYTEGLVRLRYKTLKHNTLLLNNLENIIKLINIPTSE